MLVALLGSVFVSLEQHFGAARELAGQTAVAGLVHQELAVSAGRSLGIQRELLGLESRVEAEHIPVTAVHSLLHFLLAVHHAALDGVHLARGIANDQRRAVVSFGFLDGLQGLGLVGAHGDLCHIDIAVAHGDLRKALLLDFLAGYGKLCNLADVGSLGSLAAGVGIHFGIEHEDVDVLVGRQHVVHAAEADIIGPAVASEDPHGLLVQVILVGKDLFDQIAAVAGLELGNQSLGGSLVGLAVAVESTLTIDVNGEKFASVTKRKAGRKKKNATQQYEEILAYRETHTAQETFEWLGLTKQTYYRRIKELKKEAEQESHI